MKLTTRDKWIWAILPALLTAIIYQRGFQRPVHNDIEALEQQLRTQGPVSVRSAEVSRLEKERTTLERKLQTDRTASQGHAEFNRTTALEQVSKLCETTGLTLISSAPDAAAKLPPSIEQIAAVLVHPTDPVTPQLWHLELRGSYGGMVELLDGLVLTTALIVPLSLSMEPDPDETKPLNWTLTLWL